MIKRSLLILFFCMTLNPMAYAEPATTASSVDAYLEAKSSPMGDIGATQIDASTTNKVDPRLIVAIAGAETTFGKKVCVDNNAWNWFHGGTCANSPFATWKAGAQTVSKFIRKSYLDQGLNTIALIGKKYCASGCENWASLVLRFYANEQAGDAGNLGYQH